MTTQLEDIQTLLDAERDQLVAVLDRLDDSGWRTASLCAGWEVRDVVAHLLMPYELSMPRFFAGMAKARFRFDTMAYRWARRDRRSGGELVQALRETAHQRFAVPGAPPEAPLSHLLTHAEDIYLPLGVEHRPGSRAAVVVLDQLVGPRGSRALRPGLVDGLRLIASDTEWTHGSGADVVGPARALVTTIAGRSAALGELTGSGMALLGPRLAAEAA
jgi:uncharacterized protein (TIGR03083 family)